MKSHIETIVSELPSCDFCNNEDVQAEYDVRTHTGAWANVCEKHFRMGGFTLGLGKGQKLVKGE